MKKIFLYITLVLFAFILSSNKTKSNDECSLNIYEDKAYINCYDQAEIAAHARIIIYTGTAEEEDNLFENYFIACLEKNYPNSEYLQALD
jgi:hypothetical protein